MNVYVFECVCVCEREGMHPMSESYRVNFMLDICIVVHTYKEERESVYFMVLWFNTLSLSLLTMSSLGSVRPIIRIYYTRMFRVFKSCQCFTLAIWCVSHPMVAK